MTNYDEDSFLLDLTYVNAHSYVNKWIYFTLFYIKFKVVTVF